MFKSIKTRLIVLVSILALLLIGGSTFYNCREAGNILEDTLLVEAENDPQIESILMVRADGEMINAEQFDI